MIRTLVVDDNPVAVGVHRQFVERLDGFSVVAVALSGSDAVRLADEVAPDLVLLDMYLPDRSGIDVLHRLRAPGRPPVDVIAITSAKDTMILRSAMSLGVVHYIVKPFTFRTFRARLEHYAAARQELASASSPGQREVDRIFGLLRAGSSDMLPKGISAPTLRTVVEILRTADAPVPAGDVAARAGFSESVARRYLKFLTDSGSVSFDLRYGTAGRPEHLYRWAGGH